MTRPLISIIIINHNGFADTVRCLKSIYKYSGSMPPFEIILIDNASEKDEITALKKSFTKNITYFRSPKNLGFAAGCNLGITRSSSPYICLLNNDTVVTGGWLKAMLRLITSSPKVAAVQAKLRSLSMPAYFDPSAAGGYLDRLGYPYTRGRIGVHIEKDLGQYDNEAELFWAAGAAVLLRRSALARSGLLPENFFAYHEETDLCWRLQNLGFKILFCPRALVYHKVEASWRKKRTRKIFYLHRNSLFLVTRNSSLPSLIWVLPLRLALDMATATLYLFQKKPKFLLALILADLAFFLSLPSLAVYRLKRPRFPAVADRRLKPFSVYFHYYLLKQTRFSDIFNLASEAPTILYRDIVEGNNVHRRKITTK